MLGVSFYRPIAEDRFEATPYTRGPWDAGSQHAGPPAALLGRAVERQVGRDDMRVVRLAFDIVRPVPIGRLSVSTRVVRAGRSVAIVESELIPDGEPTAMRVTAMLIRTETAVAPAVSYGGPPEFPDGTAEEAFFPVPYDVGYHTAMEYRFAAGSFLAPGPATCWMRMRVPLVEGEEPSPLSRVLVAADSGNGVSSVLDWRRYLFINPDLTVHLHRYPTGEWVCLDARTWIDPDGVGLAEAAVYDRTGALGRTAQSLFVAPR
ncbi:MAG: thioesterase family protein [Micromonosporaceae bacterium]|nr:thioesterase family protein [Micromonosporaceae bacterium]